MPEPIFEPGPVDTPFVYTVSGTGEIVPRACQAVYDGSGAGGDYVPAVIFRSQAGHVIARAILQSTVTAGDDAEVSWFPGVKAAAAAAPAAGLPIYGLLALSVENFGDTGVVIPNNTVTDVQFPHQDASGSGAFAFGPSTTYSDTVRLTSFDYLYVFRASARWHLTGFKQQTVIEGPSPVSPTPTIFGPLDNHGQTPANTFTTGGVFLGDNLWAVDTKTFVPETLPGLVTLQVFQTSGIDQTLDEANLLVIAYQVF
jgi:hypothetical protein